MIEPRYCSNCRAALAPDANTCAACGVFAGDLFDGRIRPPRRKPSGLLFGLLVVAVLGGAAYWFVQNRQSEDARAHPEPPLPATHVVKDRPGGTRRASGAAVTEAEAVRLLRRHLVETKHTRDECIAILSRGPRSGSYTFSVTNSCEHIRLGTWRVDGKTGAVVPAL